MSVDDNSDDYLGLPPKVVRLRNHAPVWRRLYFEEEARLRETIGRQLLDVQHVGSTCIETIKAKPIIDILAGVTSFNVGTRLVEPLKTIHYTYLGNTLVPDHHVFAKGSHRSFLLHVVEHDSPAWTRVVSFRDILKTNPLVAKQYEALKVDLSEKFRDDRAAYADAKTWFIDDVIRSGA